MAFISARSSFINHPLRYKHEEVKRLPAKIVKQHITDGFTRRSTIAYARRSTWHKKRVSLPEIPFKILQILLQHALVDHGIGNFEEAGHVSAFHVVDITIWISAIFHA